MRHSCCVGQFNLPSGLGQPSRLLAGALEQPANRAGGRGRLSGRVVAAESGWSECLGVDAFVRHVDAAQLSVDRLHEVRWPAQEEIEVAERQERLQERKVDATLRLVIDRKSVV